MRCSRRDLLVAFLGLPAAIAGCSGGHKTPDLTGELVGPNADLGHGLRNEPPPTVSADRLQRIGTLIVGGGISGLAAAWRLAWAGVRDFVLLELETSPGGTSRSGSNSVASYPWGAHYVPVPMK